MREQNLDHGTLFWVNKDGYKLSKHAFMKSMRQSEISTLLFDDTKKLPFFLAVVFCVLKSCYLEIYTQVFRDEVIYVRSAIKMLPRGGCG